MYFPLFVVDVERLPIAQMYKVNVLESKSCEYGKTGVQLSYLIVRVTTLTWIFPKAR